MRQSSSFRGDGIAMIDDMFTTLLRGGDISVMLKSELARRVMSKFAKMRVMAAKRPDPSIRKPRSLNATRIDYAEVMTAVGLEGVLTRRQIAKLLGIRKELLRWRIDRWRKHVREMPGPMAEPAE